MLVSAAFGGLPALAVKRAFQGEVWISTDIKKELLSLGRFLPKRLSQPQLLTWNAALLPLLSKMRLARVPRHLHLSRDPKDDIYLSLALAVSADYLVTGDKDLLSIESEKLDQAGFKNFSIVTPRDHLDRTGN